MKQVIRKRATLRQVADQAQVSTATVSRVLSGADPVAADKAERVRAAAALLNYEPNRFASGLRRNRTGNIGLILPGFTNDFFFQLIAQSVEVGREEGYSVLVTGSEDPEDEAQNLIKSQLVDGILIVAAHTSNQSAVLNESPVPIVGFDRAPFERNYPLVHVDNEHGGWEVTRYLLDTGARTVAHIAGPSEVLASARRQAGYERALLESGLSVDDRLIVTGDFTSEAGHAAARQLLQSSGKPVDAIFAANDLMAIGAMRAASELGMAIPEELVVVGFDGITSGNFTVPGLTTYVQPIAKMARLAMLRLIESIDNPENQRNREQIMVNGDLIVRESSSTRD
ncbi:LacI family DNA-binding transcriptional regulator [Jonesiaceae bacterium BS-20]|uniref:LacI family DNA-binding transcriptional regulator n=1 Tax=Jonesiaceae bacterium BS-20 TaxID=3120821 RepID=A0AAU7DU37_9MICO